jgi:hypothetical protein
MQLRTIGESEDKYQSLACKLREQERESKSFQAMVEQTEEERERMAALLRQQNECLGAQN